MGKERKWIAKCRNKYSGKNMAETSLFYKDNVILCIEQHCWWVRESLVQINKQTF